MVSITTQALKTLALAGAAILVTDDRHYPCAVMLPFSGNLAAPQRLHEQIRLIETPVARELWAQIVRARLKSQAVNLRYFDLNGALRLERLVEEVKPGDVSNAEAQGAKHYWKQFFGAEFTREKEGADDGLNARLNYGFAVLRALVARQLAMSGLNAALGIGHRRQDNPFNLADDFTEPFRYLVERHVRGMEDVADELTSTIKVALLGFMEQEVEMGGQNFRLGSAVAEVVASYCRILERQDGQLRLP
jgi:CRISPR-associated protein Cas1